MDWKAARKSLPFTGRSHRPGGKTTAPCPRCGSRSYGYHGGRFKDCLKCGYDRFAEKLFDHVRFLMIRGRAAELKPGQIKQAEDYYLRVYRANAT